eukprot:8789182-Alexandrium_andersonii.AAC.1
MAAPVPVEAGYGSVSTDVGSQVGRKPTRWMNSSPEVLKRVRLRRGNEGLPAGDPGLHEHAVLQGKGAAGVNLTARAA